MKKWLLTFVAATLTCGAAIPVMADTTTTTNDHAYPYIDVNNPAVGSSTNLHINFFGLPAANTALQVHTTLGALNGQGPTTSITPSNGTFANVTLSSTTAGVATVTISEGGTVIGSTQVTFVPGPVQYIKVQATPSNPVVGGTTAINITATDVYGNPVADNTMGTSITLNTTEGQLFASGMTATNGSGITVSTHNGVAQAYLSNSTADTVNVSLSDSNLPASATINGTSGVSTVTIPITFTVPQAVTVTPFNDYGDVSLSTPAQLDAEREMSAAGVFHGDPYHNFNPTTSMSRGEFAEVVAQYMGLGSVATNLSGTQTKFADVDPSAWYDGAVAVDYSFGYVKGDGTNYYPQNSISYAEVAMILLNNLSVQTTGSWPNNAMNGGQTYGLFNGLGSFNASAPATRGDVAIMVRNAMHLVPPVGALNTNGRTLEAEELGYTWTGENQSNTVIGIPGSGTVLGNELQVQSASQSTTLHLANTVQMIGATSLSDLMNKNINYLTNSLGLVTYIEVTP